MRSGWPASASACRAVASVCRATALSSSALTGAHTRHRAASHRAAAAACPDLICTNARASSVIALQRQRRRFAHSFSSRAVARDARSPTSSASRSLEVEVGDVEHRVADLSQRQRPFRIEQRQRGFPDARPAEVALRRGSAMKFQGVAPAGLFPAAQAIGDPPRQLGERRCRQLDRGPALPSAVANDLFRPFPVECRQRGPAAGCRRRAVGNIGCSSPAAPRLRGRACQWGCAGRSACARRTARDCRPLNQLVPVRSGAVSIRVRRNPVCARRRGWRRRLR